MNTDWEELGEFDWHYTVATGPFGDDAPECDLAWGQRDRNRAHLPHLGAIQLRAYLDGVLKGADSFMWRGL